MKIAAFIASAILSTTVYGAALPVFAPAATPALIAQREPGWKSKWGTPIGGRDAEAEPQKWGTPIIGRDAEASPGWKSKWGTPVGRRDAEAGPPKWGTPIFRRDQE